MSYDITLIPGDGIGPEVIRATARVLEATGITFKWDEQEAGEGVMEKYGTPLPDHVIESIKRNRFALKGPITTPIGTGFRSVNVALRQTLDLYACLRPCKSYAGVLSRYSDVDLVIVRENTEGLYCGIEFEKGTGGLDKLIALVKENEGKEIDKNSGVSLKVISEKASRRILQFAFEYARKNGRKKVSTVHKANILKYSDGLFLSVAREVAREYTDIEFEDVIIDNMCMQLVRNPDQYDVLVLPNLFGDIVSDLCAGLVGGLGVAPGANIGDGYAVFEPTHGSAPKYKGLNKTNPMATMLSGVLMLRYLGHKQSADKMERALAEVIAEGKSVTYDLKSDRDDVTAVGTSEVADAVIERMKSLK